ncbi:MAG: hypothetical protein ACE5JA_09150, partial [bacterium]
MRRKVAPSLAVVSAALQWILDSGIRLHLQVAAYFVLSGFRAAQATVPTGFPTFLGPIFLQFPVVAAA